MVQIVVSAHEPIATGAIVTGYGIGENSSCVIYSCEPVRLARIYKGFGKIRAESVPAKRRGFGTLIGCAEISQREIGAGLQLWLRVKD